jgi:hypothetical protein
MNITQATWENEKQKEDLIAWIKDHASYAVLPDFTHQDRKWKGLRLLHDFNILPFYFSKCIYKVAALLHIESMLNYLCVQKVYTVTKAN